MKIAIALLIGAAAAANVPHGRTVPESLKSVTPSKYGTCKHVACVRHKGHVHVFHTTNNGVDAHGPSLPHQREGTPDRLRQRRPQLRTLG